MLEVNNNLSAHPSYSKLKKYLYKWENDEEINRSEEALKKLFTCIYPANESIEGIILKVAALNTVYNTYIPSIYPMAKHIHDLHIDARLQSGDVNLIGDLMGIDYKREDKIVHINHYSFASKYCSFHNPLAFPIYDHYVDKILWHFQCSDHFYPFKRKELKDYPSFKRIILAFQKHYGLKCNFKELDHYLWLLGKNILTNGKSQRTVSFKT